MAERNDIKKLVLMPMLKIYAPPAHIGSDQALQKKILEQYIEALKPYPVVTVNQAAKRVFASHFRWDWPVPALFVAECNKLTEGI